MQIDVSLPEQMEEALRRKAATRGQDLKEYLRQIIVAEAEEQWPEPPKGEGTSAWMGRLQAMIQRHAVRCGHVDDSRESIYAGCGE